MCCLCLTIFKFLVGQYDSMVNIHFCSCLSRPQFKRMCASSSSEDLLFHDVLCIFYVYFVASYYLKI